MKDMETPGRGLSQARSFSLETCPVEAWGQILMPLSAEPCDVHVLETCGEDSTESASCRGPWSLLSAWLFPAAQRSGPQLCHGQRELGPRY